MPWFVSHELTQLIPWFLSIKSKSIQFYVVITWYNDCSYMCTPSLPNNLKLKSYANHTI